MYRSKVRATPEEVEELTELNQQALSTPVFALSSEHAMTGGASADARRRVIRRMDEIAISHGLSPQAGEWGMDLDGTFLSEHPIVEAADGI